MPQSLAPAGFDGADADLLGARGFVLIDGWLGRERALALRAELLLLLERGCFAESRVGHGPKRHRSAGVRSDQVCWFAADADVDGVDGRRGVRPGPEMLLFLVRLEELRERLNSFCFLSLAELECHAACYEPGSRYDAHVDVFADDARRVISFSHYLNEPWSVDDGGALRVHHEGGPTDVEPLLDRLVLFQSRRMLHEVRLVARRRLSTTGWMSAR